MTVEGYLQGMGNVKHQAIFIPEYVVHDSKEHFVDRVEIKLSLVITI